MHAFRAVRSARLERAAALARVALVSLAVITAAVGCDIGAGTETKLLPGPATTQPPGRLVVYACMSRADRVDAYRVGTDGRLEARPFSRVLGLENPRRLTVANGVLYVALFSGIVSLELGEDGSLPSKPTAATTPFPGQQIFEMKVRGDRLYAAAEGFSRVEAYELDDQGRIASDPESVSSGNFSTTFRTLDLQGDFLYAAGRDSSVIDIFHIRSDGSLPEQAEIQIPETFIGLPDDLLIDQGVLHVTNGGGQNISSFFINGDALLSDEPDAETEGGEFYANLEMGDGVIYAAAFQRGRIDTFPIDPTTGLAEEAAVPLLSTAADPASLPSGLVRHLNVLYVSQAGLGRVDAYFLNSAGLPTEFPSSSTDEVEDGFPTDVAIYELD